MPSSACSCQSHWILGARKYKFQGTFAETGCYCTQLTWFHVGSRILHSDLLVRGISFQNCITLFLFSFFLQKAESCHLQSLKPPSSVTSSSSSNSKTNGVISCIVGEARPLTQAEMSSLRHLLPHTPRKSLDSIVDL